MEKRGGVPRRLTLIKSTYFSHLPLVICQKQLSKTTTPSLAYHSFKSNLEAKKKRNGVCNGGGVNKSAMLCR